MGSVWKRNAGRANQKQTGSTIAASSAQPDPLGDPPVLPGGSKSLTDAGVYGDRAPFCLYFDHGFISTTKAPFIGIGIAIEFGNRP